jgi:metal-responsive CopG/Arc/MetJ family transcriptional regulator
MQRSKAYKYRTVALPDKMWKEISKIVEASGGYSSEAEFVRDAVREKVQQFAIVSVKDIPDQELRDLVVEYIKKHGKAYPSDIAADLQVPYFTLLNIINDLVETGTIEPAKGASD